MNCNGLVLLYYVVDEIHQSYLALCFVMAEIQFVSRCFGARDDENRILYALRRDRKIECIDYVVYYSRC